MFSRQVIGAPAAARSAIQSRDSATLARPASTPMVSMSNASGSARRMAFWRFFALLRSQYQGS